MKQFYEIPETDVLILQEEENLCTSVVETDDVSVSINGFNDEQEW